MLSLLLAGPTLSLLFAGPTLAPRHSAVAPRVAPPLCAAQGRFREALPKRDDLDREIMGMALPSIANLAVIPLVGAVDTLWIGRMGSALALAGQGAATQCFFSTYFLIAFIPTITAPLVASAAGSGDIEGACKRVCEALFLANALGLVGTLMLVLRPEAVLSLVLPAGAPAAAEATRYLRLRSLSLIPALVSSIGFARPPRLEHPSRPCRQPWPPLASPGRQPRAARCARVAASRPPGPLSRAWRTQRRRPSAGCSTR